MLPVALSHITILYILLLEELLIPGQKHILALTPLTNMPAGLLRIKKTMAMIKYFFIKYLQINI